VFTVSFSVFVYVYLEIMQLGLFWLLFLAAYIYIAMALNYINVLIAFLVVINIMYGPPRSENESRRPPEPETSGAG